MNVEKIVQTFFTGDFNQTLYYCDDLPNDNGADIQCIRNVTKFLLCGHVNVDEASKMVEEIKNSLSVYCQTYVLCGLICHFKNSFFDKNQLMDFMPSYIIFINGLYNALEEKPKGINTEKSIKIVFDANLGITRKIFDDYSPRQKMKADEFDKKQIECLLMCLNCSALFFDPMSQNYVINYLKRINNTYDGEVKTKSVSVLDEIDEFHKKGTFPYNSKEYLAALRKEFADTRLYLAGILTVGVDKEKHKKLYDLVLNFIVEENKIDEIKEDFRKIKDLEIDAPYDKYECSLHKQACELKEQIEMLERGIEDKAFKGDTLRRAKETLKNGKVVFYNGLDKIEEINPKFNDHLDKLRKIHNESYEELAEEIINVFGGDDNSN